MRRRAWTLVMMAACGGAPVRPVTPAPPPTARAPVHFTAAQIVARVERTYAGVTRMRAKFRHVRREPTFGHETQADGMLWILPHDRMRWDYGAPPAPGRRTRFDRSVIGTPAGLFDIDSATATSVALRPGAAALPVAVAFLYGPGSLSADFHARLDVSGRHGGGPDPVVELTPKTPAAAYRRLWLVVDRDRFRVREAIVEDAAGTIDHIRFFEPDLAAQVKDAWFVPPP